MNTKRGRVRHSDLGSCREDGLARANVKKLPNAFVLLGWHLKVVPACLHGRSNICKRNEGVSIWALVAKTVCMTRGNVRELH
jgi:hypothetical protein